MKGFLSFIILWLISKKTMTGAEISNELEKRRGHRPSPGTIYPVLKDLVEKGLLNVDEKKRYSLSDHGKKELDTNLSTFFDMFFDVDEMKSKCKCHDHNLKRGHH
jgi:DNA-binding PadR family transcriptional regulator